MEKISYPEEIESVFDQIVKEIRDVLDPEYIIIAGSFGKDSWIYSNKNLLSDFEFVFVCKKRWSTSLKKKLLIRLNENYSADISLKGYLLKNIQKKILSNYSFKNPGYLSLDFFDTFKDPHILYQKNIISELPTLQNNELPVWEAWRLLVNRMGHFLELSIDKKGSQPEQHNYCWLKLFEAAAEGYLLINKLYHPNINRRLEKFTSDRVTKDSELTDKCKCSFKIIQSTMLARQMHNISFFKVGNIKEKKKFFILNEWVSFVNKKMFLSENINIVTANQYNWCAENKMLQNKYLLTNVDFLYNILFSNILRLIHKPFLIRQGYKYYNIKYSSKHIILLTVALTFNEFFNNLKYSNSKLMLGKIIKEDQFKRLNGELFIRKVVQYWKALRQ